MLGREDQRSSRRLAGLLQSPTLPVTRTNHVGPSCGFSSGDNMHHKTKLDGTSGHLAPSSIQKGAPISVSSLWLAENVEGSSGF